MQAGSESRIDELMHYSELVEEELRYLLNYIIGNLWDNPGNQIVGALLNELIELTNGIRRLFRDLNVTAMDNLGRSVLERNVQILYILSKDETQKDIYTSAYDLYQLKEGIEALSRQITKVRRNPTFFTLYSENDLIEQRELFKQQLNRPHLAKANEKHDTICKSLKNSTDDKEKRRLRTILKCWHLLFSNGKPGFEYLLKESNLRKDLESRSDLAKQMNFNFIYGSLSETIHGKTALNNCSLSTEGYLLNQRPGFSDREDIEKLTHASKLAFILNDNLVHRVKSFYKITDNKMDKH